ncbi:hypothetical protein CHCC14820_0441 [Bacillus paralicheniformis]|nr:hypothetical protein CHCC14820_0441 [Bacillus paralicheniformis]
MENSRLARFGLLPADRPTRQFFSFSRGRTLPTVLCFNPACRRFPMQQVKIIELTGIKVA